ncbi:MAG: LuxR C-terminal-related transcriptional regulator [Cyanobacteria bacterium P01_A01_bin.135]
MPAQTEASPSQPDINATQLIVDLQKVSQIVERFAGNLDPNAIATTITDALIKDFDCAFARLWLMEADRKSLRLVASSGLHTRLDGDFARVPMGAYKVGKIAQNRVPFLSNQLTQEAWVKDRDWAIANQLRGFAGYPLTARGQVIGVLVSFSRKTMATEFLEVLQVLCTAAAVGLSSAIQVQTSPTAASPPLNGPLSEWLAAILAPVQLTLVGTEQPTTASTTYAVLRAGERLAQLQSHHCQLTYGAQALSLKAILAVTDSGQSPTAAMRYLNPLHHLVASCQGSLQIAPDRQGTLLQFSLSLPYSDSDGQPSSNGDGGALLLSDREQEILSLLSQGYRDRDIAQTLHISQSTVKFHINNSITKLRAKNRYQAVYKAAIYGWI